MSAAASPVRNAGEPPPRGRPTANRAARIDEAILEAAFEIFIERGFEGATMESVAERARVSKGTVYARFPGKEALLRKVIEATIEAWSDYASKSNHLLPDDLMGRLQHHAGMFYRMYGSEDVRRFTLLVEQAASHFPELAAFWLEVGTYRYRDLLAQNLAEVAGPDLAGTDWTLVAELLLHGLSGWLRTEPMVREVREEEVRSYAQRLATQILRIAPRPGTPDDQEGCSR